MSWGAEVSSLPGHENLTMHDQMRARNVSSHPHTSPVTGAVENPRREYLKNRIAYRQGKYNSGNEAKDNSHVSYAYDQQGSSI